MKKIFLLLAVLFVFTGCAQRYTLITGSGNRVTAFGKPKLKDGNYVFKDGQGRTKSIPAGRVRQIAPESESRPNEFNSGTSR